MKHLPGAAPRAGSDQLLHVHGIDLGIDAAPLAELLRHGLPLSIIGWLRWARQYGLDEDSPPVIFRSDGYTV